MASETHQDAILTGSGADGPTVPTVDPHAIVREHWRDADEARARGPLDVAFCARCGEAWRGGATDGGCTMRLLALRVIALEGEMDRREWVDNNDVTPDTDWCPACGRDRAEGHSDHCRWVAVMRAPRAGEGGGG